MSVAEQASERGVARTQTYGTIVIVGGGCYGSYYVRQLRRAMQAKALVAKRLVIVDRDPRCAVASVLDDDESGVPAEIAAREWREFFNDYLSSAAADPG